MKTHLQPLLVKSTFLCFALLGLALLPSTASFAQNSGQKKSIESLREAASPISTQENVSPAKKLLGTWETTFWEKNTQYKMEYSMSANKRYSAKMWQVGSYGQPVTWSGSWQISEDNRYSQTFDGEKESADATFRWNGDDEYTLTMTKHPDPSNIGKKLTYQRVNSATDQNAVAINRFYTITRTDGWAGKAFDKYSDKFKTGYNMTLDGGGSDNTLVADYPAFPCSSRLKLINSEETSTGNFDFTFQEALQTNKQNCEDGLTVHIYFNTKNESSIEVKYYHKTLGLVSYGTLNRQ